MSQTARFQNTLRRLAIFDEGFVGAGFGTELDKTSAPDAKTMALLQAAVSVAIGSWEVCPQRSATRALAAGATKDEITDVLLTVVPMAGLGRSSLPVRGWQPRSNMTSAPRRRNQTIVDSAQLVTSDSG